MKTIEVRQVPNEEPVFVWVESFYPLHGMSAVERWLSKINAEAYEKEYGDID